MRVIRAFVSALALFVLTSTVAIPTSTVAAGSEVSRFNFKGQAADAFFRTDEGCFQTTVIVLGVDEKLKQSGSRHVADSFAFVIVDVFNTCTNRLHLSSFGETQLEPDDFVISNDLSTASLVTSIEVFDFEVEAA